MKNSFTSLFKMTALLVGVLSLGSCSRSEYAMLPKVPAYGGTLRVATPVHATPAPTALASPATTVAQAPAAPPAAAPDGAVTAASAATAAQASATTLARAAQPVVAQTPAASAAVAVGAPAAAPKLNLLQRVALTKVSKKLNKTLQKAGFNRHENTANTARLDGKLRQGLILLLVGLLVGIVGGAVGGSIGYIIGILGLILAIVGIVLIVLYLLDEL